MSDRTVTYWEEVGATSDSERSSPALGDVSDWLGFNDVDEYMECCDVLGAEVFNDKKRAAWMKEYQEGMFEDDDEEWLDE